jgi:hypothetical protein
MVVPRDTTVVRELLINQEKNRLPPKMEWSSTLRGGDGVFQSGANAGREIGHNSFDASR